MMLGLLLLRISLLSLDYGTSLFSRDHEANNKTTDAAGVVSTMETSLESIIVIPAVMNHSSTIIFLHGLGDTGEGWADEIAAIKPPHAKLICPTAPSKPITIYYGQEMPAWYDIRSLTRIDEDTKGIDVASKYIQNLIQKEFDTGISPDRIILAGFSQGAAMSIYTGLTGNFSLAGIVAMSGYIPAIETIKWEQVQTPPILQCHGELDAIVGFDIALATKDVFEQLEFPNFTFKSYKDTGHSASAQEIHDIKKFFARVLA